MFIGQAAAGKQQITRDPCGSARNATILVLSLVVELKLDAFVPFLLLLLTSAQYVVAMTVDVLDMTKKSIPTMKGQCGYPNPFANANKRPQEATGFERLHPLQ